MPDTISLSDWLNVIDSEYMSTFIRDGGSSVKFAVTPEGLRTELSLKMESMCRKLDYVHIEFNAEKRRVHMPQDIFFELAEQIDWRRLARRMVLKLAEEQGYQVGGIAYTRADNIFDAISKANGLESDFVLGTIRPKIQNSVFRNTKMAKDFRVCMSHLCLQEDTRGEYTGHPLLEWLTGKNTRIGGVRPFSIYTSISRATARFFIESALYWIRYVGHAGTVVLMDNARVTVARNPRDGLRYYTRPMAMEHYELLREFIDGLDRLAGTLLVVVTNNEFLDDSAVRGSRGYGIYQALQTRIMDDVRDRNRPNPIGSLVRLAQG